MTSKRDEGTIERILKTYKPVDGMPGYVWFSEARNIYVSLEELRGIYQDYFKSLAGSEGDGNYENFDTY